MNFRYLFFFLTVLVSAAFSQVTIVPANATENDSITIYFDATKGDAGLKGFTGDVYAHTGVNTTVGTWRFVMAAWATNFDDIKLTRDSTDHYHLVIGHPRTYYSNNHQNLGSIPPSEHIQQLAFVFRNADGSKSGRAAGGANIYTDIFTQGLFVVVNNPQVTVQYGDPLRSPAFARHQDTVNINIEAVTVGTKLSSLTLFINNTQKAQSSSATINYKFIAAENNYGGNIVTAIGVDTSGKSDTSSFVIFINSSVQNAPPPANIVPGINYTDNNTVVLALIAPYKDFVYVLGDFNDWKVDTSYFMKKFQVTPDSVLWWLTVSSLTQGQEYIFQYLVNGNLRIADPFADKISDPSDDQYINSATYPGLIKYPGGKSSEIASVLQTAQQPYQWQTLNFQKPKKGDLVIYELLIRDFIAEHSYKKLVDTLGYLKRLGVNAIELMPVMEFEGNESWGYNPDFHFAPDKYYGTKNDLKGFIDEAHKNGIAVILDIVLNHMYGQSPLVRLYWNSALNRPAPESPWFNQVSPNTAFVFGYDFNHEKSATQYYVDRVNKYWLTEYHADGFRFDFTKGFTNTPGDGGSYDQSRVNILSRMADQIKKVDSTAYIILEHFVPGTEETILQLKGMMVWANLNPSFNQVTMGYIDNSDISGESYKSRGWTSPNLVSYMESHDEERLMYKNLQFGNSSGNYNVKNLQTALQRIKLAAAFYFTVPGAKMIWQFGELGYDYSINYNGRIGDKPIRWDYYNDPARQKLYKTFAALIALKKYPAFESNNFTLYGNTAVKILSIVDSTMDVFAIGNMDVSPRNTNYIFPKKGYWYNYLTGDSLMVTDSVAAVTLQPGEFFVYTSVKLPVSDPDIVNSVETDNTPIPNQFILEQNYPNPFNPATTISFKIANNSFVSLKVYDILGNEVKTLVNEQKSPGVYSAQFEASKLSSGVYFYKLEAGSYNEVKKMILLK